MTKKPTAKGVFPIPKGWNDYWLCIAGAPTKIAGTGRDLSLITPA
ncbi:MAG TPA: hypothetical protein VLH37_01425 [Bacteroidales bacterium]|nr:hypothetical protein [Bacteroidales bacterium]